MWLFYQSYYKMVGTKYFDLLVYPQYRDLQNMLNFLEFLSNSYIITIAGAPRYIPKVQHNY